jgi:hypothetical protein
MNYQETGILRAFAFVPLMDLNGQSRMRRLNVGVAHETQDTAREMVRKAREANPGLDVRAKFEIVL